MMLSIIIPIYNAESYIENLITKLVGIDNNEFEFILIDDGSKDNSEKLILNYIDYYKDSRLKYYKKNNNGISSARNYGINVANGKYIVFFDQDDDFDQNILERNIQIIKEKNYDFFIGSYLIITRDDIQEKKQEVVYDDCTYCKSNEIINVALNLNRKQIGTTIWNCIYKKEIIKSNNITFNEQLKFGGEDNLFNTLYMLKCKSIKTDSYIVYKYYRYINNNANTSLKFNKNYYQDEMLSLNTKYQELIKFETLENTNKYISYLYLRGLKQIVNYNIMQKKQNIFSNYKNIKFIFYNNWLSAYKKGEFNIVKTDNKKYDLYIHFISVLIFFRAYFIVYIMLIIINHYDVTP